MPLKQKENSDSDSLQLSKSDQFRLFNIICDSWVLIVKDRLKGTNLSMLMVMYEMYFISQELIRSLNYKTRFLRFLRGKETGKGEWEKEGGRDEEVSRVVMYSCMECICPLRTDLSCC